MSSATSLLRSSVVVALVGCGLGAGTVQASSSPVDDADRPAVRAETSHRADPRFGAAARRTAEARAQQRSAETATTLRLPDTERLVVRTVERDADGAEHVHYDRTYRGLPVVGGDLIVHQSPGGSVRSTDWGPTRAVGRLATTPRLSAATARGSDDRLVVFAANHAPVLAWAGQVRGREDDGTPVNDVVYTDAATGKRLAVSHHVQTDTGTGRTLYSGSVVLQVAKSGGKYTLTDTANGGHKTYAKGGSESTTRGALVSSADKTFGNGKTSDGQSAAADAHYGAAKTWGFYKNSLGRLGIRGDGVGAYSRVHFGKNFDNAFWDDACFCMTYGDGGGGSGLRQLVSLDVAGHEMTHGVTSNTAGLEYFGDAGGLNESTSDVMGTMVEFYANRTTDPGDYYIGEKIVAVAPNYLRRMDNQHADGFSYNCYPGPGEFDDDPDFTDDPHFTSGVGNHAFYLLSEGTGTKTIGGRAHKGVACDRGTVGGIGRDAAARIWYRALSTYWLSSETYPGAADGMIKAARDLYGPASEECLATKRAWEASDVTTTESCSGTQGGTRGPNALSSPGFEPSNAAWTGSGVITTLVNAGRGPHGGSYYATFGGEGVANTDTLQQQVTVPTGAEARLTFWLRVNSQEDPSDGTAYDTFAVQVLDGAGTHTVRTYSNLDYSYGVYALKGIDLSAWKGQTVTLKFVGKEDRDTATAFLLDDLDLYALS